MREEFISLLLLSYSVSQYHPSPPKFVDVLVSIESVDSLDAAVATPQTHDQRYLGRI